MIEFIITVILLIYGAYTGNASYLIASGLFAIACNLNKEDK